jgi:hypothetical protein
VDQPERDAAGPPAGARGPAAPAAAEEAIRTCPVCGKRLEERRCKLVCPDPLCGYFLSCADYY